MRKLEVGDRVRIHRLDDLDHGVECTVIVCDQTGYNEDGSTYVGYEVDTPHDIRCVDCLGHVYERHELVLLYDGDQLVAWSDCLWQPTNITANGVMQTPDELVTLCDETSLTDQ